MEDGFKRLLNINYSQLKRLTPLPFDLQRSFCHANLAGWDRLRQQGLEFDRVLRQPFELLESWRKIRPLNLGIGGPREVEFKLDPV